jgi:hypothetical protein
MSFPVLEHVAKTARDMTFYLSCGRSEDLSPLGLDKFEAQLAPDRTGRRH